MTPESRTAPGEDRELTASQRLIWTGQRLQPGEPLYNMVLAFHISGELEGATFARAFQALVDRCDVLRVALPGDAASPDTPPRQRFRERFEAPFAQLDFSADTDPRARLAAWLDEHKVLDLDPRECLFESALIRLAPDAYVWYLNQHHLITDAWSCAVLFERLQAFYALARAGRLDDAPGLPLYRDYVEHEHARRDSPAQQKSRAYWEARLRSPTPPSRFYREPPTEAGGRTERVVCVLGAQRSAALRALAAEPGFRAFTGELALFQVFATLLLAYLARVTGNRTLAIGTPSHNRGSAQFKATAGLFIEIFPLQATIEEGETFASLYAKVARAAQELLMHAQPGASGAAHNRAYDVLLNFITASFGDFDGRATRTEWIHAGYGDRSHLLRLQVEDFDRADALGVYFDLNVDAFSREERDWVPAHFLRLLDAFLDDPGQALEGVALLDPASVTAVAAAAPAETVVDLFEQQARSGPERVALACDGVTLTYAELDRRADRLARGLRERGAGPGTRVAIALPRSPEALVAILGVLKCAAAYVPLDTAYPPARIARILDAAAPLLVLSDAAARDCLGEFDGEVSDLDEVAVGEAGGAAPPVSRPGPADVAYVIYTSGSTGKPKGVLVGHAGLANYVTWARKQYLGERPGDFPLFSSLAFDLTVTSLFVPLISGGRVVVYPERAGEIAVHRVIEDNAVDVVKLTPVHLSLLQSLDLAGSRIHTLILGGEDLKVDLARTVTRRFGGEVAIYNEYGPTEATVGCMVHRFDPARDTATSVPIGRAIDNLSVHVLDARRNPLPRGVAGELYIGGVGLAHGYLDPDPASAERFVPAEDVPWGERLYRSGDLARCNEDGVLEYLGREDHQVKIHGVRIELGEIEAALLDFPGVRECVVEAVAPPALEQAYGEEGYCERCGLSARHPDARLDEAGVCRLCRVFAEEQDRARGYFRTLDDLREIAARARATAAGTQDCLMLLSGGKDSSYALCQLVELGFTPLVFTLDNGFISEGAKANVRRLVESLGLELVVGTTPAMNAIFVDSLNRHSNVCNGCFKTIYTLSMNLARERGLRYIVTGLSRGQIFETRVADLFKQRVFDPAQIDRTIIEARKAYHRMDDAVSRNLDVRIFDDDRVFEEIEFVDFYRYCDVTLEEMLRYLRDRAPWIRPSDTGRSTNCLINEAGIFVHKRERGYHNYALPYSWDVRLGHKERDAAREELDDHIDEQAVTRKLDEIGYDRAQLQQLRVLDKRLAAYYVAEPAPAPAELREFLARRLPQEYLPKHFVRLEALPQTPHHKVDRAALPTPDDARAEVTTAYTAPRSPNELLLAEVWAEILGVARVGVQDNFFELGGDSILNIQIVARARQRGLALTPQQIFEHPTVAGLASVAGTATRAAPSQEPLTGAVALTPIQRRFFERALPDPGHYNMAVLLEIDSALDPAHLAGALNALLDHHDALRATFAAGDAGWQQHVAEPGAFSVELRQVDAAEWNAAQCAAAAERLAAEPFDLARGPLLRCVCLAGATPTRVLLLAHHLVTDAVSWWVLLEDLARVYRHLASGEQASLPPRTTSLATWSRALQAHADGGVARAEIPYWTRPEPPLADLPLDAPGGDNDLASAATCSVTLDAERTAALLHEVPGAYQVQVPDVLATSLVRALGEWTGHNALRLDLEGHGREEVSPGLDLLRTVGWFTSVYPVTLALPPGTPDPGGMLRAIKEQLRAVPNRGIAFGALRYLSADASVREQLAALPRAQVMLNYFGQLDQALGGDTGWRLAGPLIGAFGARGPRAYPLEVNAGVYAGRLQVDWTYSTALHETATIERVASRFLALLEELVAHCLRAPGAGYTPSDFPGAGLDQRQLDRLLDTFGEAP